MRVSEDPTIEFLQIELDLVYLITVKVSMVVLFSLILPVRVSQVPHSVFGSEYVCALRIGRFILAHRESYRRQ